MRALRLVLASLEKRGARATAGIILMTVIDRWFDLRHGTRTSGWDSLEQFSISSPNGAHGRGYQATPARPFLRLLRELSIPRELGFVDFGCGRGRVLLLAAHAGFSRIIGIEFAAELAADARRNVERWSAASGRVSEIHVVEGDVLEYPIHEADGVFFLFNPFDDVVLDGVLDRIEASLSAAPRDVWIIYHNPLERSRIDRRERFHPVASRSFWGNDYCVYRSAP
jgi:SAM-dependent methyltransferase